MEKYLSSSTSNSKLIFFIKFKDLDIVETFIKSKPQFEEFCESIEHYKKVQDEIAREVYGVVTMGFYEFHREGLIDTLESLAKFMQHELIAKMTTEQQAAALKLTNEYEDISSKLLSTPTSTAELMNMKAYASTTEEKTIIEMEGRLRTVKSIYKIFQFIFK